MNGVKKSTGTIEPDFLGKFRLAEMWPFQPKPSFIETLGAWGFTHPHADILSPGIAAN